MKCRHCDSPLEQTFLDLGFAPPSNAYLDENDLNRLEKYYPLKVKVCTQCWLVQTEDYTQKDELFNAQYAYFSSTSSSWLNHAKRYAEVAIERFKLSAVSYVIEIASNDGYLLRNFVNSGIPCLGIEPTGSTAAVAERLGIPVMRKFFGEALGRQLAANNRQADLIVGNNVFAHVPDINDFARGLKAALKTGGTINLEFPHLMCLIECAQFDTIYHEHFSYLSLISVDSIFQMVGLRIYDVDQLPTHGGSLRIYGCHSDDPRETANSVNILLYKEIEYGLKSLETYNKFQSRAEKVKNDLLFFLIEQKRSKKKVVGYGAAAKGNTLLNYAGVKPDLLPFIYDAAEAKQFKYMPGSHIPILPPAAMNVFAPDIVIILPWNLSVEIKSQNAKMVNNGTTFVTVVPEIKFV